METGREAVSGRTKASIASCGLLSFVGILAETAMNVCFPVLIDELRVSLSTVQWLTTGYLLMATIVMAASAHMLRRFGPRALFLTAALLSVAGTMMCLLAPSFTVLLLGRLLQAVSTGIATPLMFQVIVQRVPREKLGLYTGLASVIISLAPALGPTYGGMLTSMWSWRGIFVGIVPMLAVIIALGTYGIHGKAIGTSTRFDFVGLTVLAATFTSLR